MFMTCLCAAFVSHVFILSLCPDQCPSIPVLTTHIAMHYTPNSYTHSDNNQPEQLHI